MEAPKKSRQKRTPMSRPRKALWKDSETECRAEGDQKNETGHALSRRLFYGGVGQQNKAGKR